MRIVNAILDWLIRACAVLACAAMAIMTVLITLEVVLRSFFNTSMYFTDEYAGYMVLAITALGVAWSREKNALLTVDFIIDRLRPAARRVVDFVYGIAALAYCLLLDWHVIVLLLRSIERKMTAATMTATPLWIPQLLLPIGFTLLCVIVARKLFRPDKVKSAPQVGQIVQE